jgi:hypothetical protein
MFGVELHCIWYAERETHLIALVLCTVLRRGSSVHLLNSSCATNNSCQARYLLRCIVPGTSS